MFKDRFSSTLIIILPILENINKTKRKIKILEMNGILYPNKNILWYTFRLIMLEYQLKIWLGYK